MGVMDFKSMGVPLVGQPVNVLAIRPVVVGQCTCGHPDAQVFTIMDPQEIASCQGCGNGYMIKLFEIKNERGEITGGCTLGRMVPRLSENGAGPIGQ